MVKHRKALAASTAVQEYGTKNSQQDQACPDIAKDVQNIECHGGYYLSIYPKIVVEPQFECVRLRRTHPNCKILLKFRIGYNYSKFIL